MTDPIVNGARTRPRRALANLTNESLAREGTKSSRTHKSAVKKAVAAPRRDFDDVYENMRTNESRYYACEDYIGSLKQIAVTHKMRTILISWLLEVADEYELCCQTVHLAVYLVDAFLTRQHHVPRTDLQLVGIASMLVAAKFEEMHPPSAHDCSYITDYTYSPKQVLDMEKTILVTIQFRINAVTSLEFKSHFQCEHPLVNYLLELALLDPVCLRHRPSQLAAAACAYVRAVIGEQIWPNAMTARSRYTFEEIRSLVTVFQDLHRKSFGLPRIRHRKAIDILPLGRIPTSKSPV